MQSVSSLPSSGLPTVPSTPQDSKSGSQGSSAQGGRAGGQPGSTDTLAKKSASDSATGKSGDRTADGQGSASHVNADGSVAGVRKDEGRQGGDQGGQGGEGRARQPAAVTEDHAVSAKLDPWASENGSSQPVGAETDSDFGEEKAYIGRGVFGRTPVTRSPGNIPRRPNPRGPVPTPPPPGYISRGAVGPGPVHQPPGAVTRPSPRIDPIGNPLALTSSQPIPGLAQLSPGYAHFMQQMQGTQNRVFQAEINKIPPVTNPEALWSQPPLSPAQKARYLYDLHTSFMKYLAYKEYLKQNDHGSVPANDADIMRSFHMRMDPLRKDPAIAQWTRETFCPAMAAAIGADPALRASLNQLVTNDIVNRGVINAALAHGLPPGDAIATAMREYGMLASLLPPGDIDRQADACSSSLAQYANSLSSSENIDWNISANMQATYQMSGTSLGTLGTAATPFVENLAKRTGLSESRVWADLGNVLNGSLSAARKGLKFVEVLKNSCGLWNSVPAAVRQAYSAGLFHVANALAGGAALALRIHAKSPANNVDMAALAFQCAQIGGATAEALGKVDANLGYLRNGRAPFSAATLENAGKLLGGFGAVASFLSFLKAVHNPDRGAAALQGIGATAGMMGSTATAVEGLMYFTGVTSFDMLKGLRYANAFVREIGQGYPIETANYFARLEASGGRLFYNVGSFMLERVGFAAIGAATAGLGDLAAAGFLIYDLAKSDVERSNAENRLYADVNDSIANTLGGVRRMQWPNRPYPPPRGGGHLQLP